MSKGIPSLFKPSKFSYYAYMTLLIIGVVVLVSVSFMAWRLRRYEGFAGDDLDKALNIGKQIQSANSDSQIKDLMNQMVSEMVSVGAFPDTNQFVRKSELTNNQCIVANATDRDQYVAKSSIPDQGPRIDMSQYIKKSAVPACPQQKCPEPVDLSGYVKKSSLFNQKQNACVCPQVKVSAGLCKECPPCPSMTCPPCPVPETPKCPPPAPCPSLPTQPVRYEIKYVKQPVLITKTVVVDSNNNVLSQHVNTDNNPNATDMNASTLAVADTTGSNSYFDFIDGVRKSYRMHPTPNDTTTTTSNNLTKYMPTTMPTTMPTNMPTTMASAPFCGEAGCLENKNLNSAYQNLGAPQGREEGPV